MGNPHYLSPCFHIRQMGGMSEKGQPRHQNALSPTEFLRGPGRSFVLDLGLVEQTTFSAGARLVYFVQTPLLCQMHDPTSLGRVATHSPDRCD